MIGLLFFFAVCALYSYWLWTWYSYRRHNEPPLHPGALPLIGHAHLLLGDSHYLWNAMRFVNKKSYGVGGAFTACIGPRTIYVISDPDDAMTVSNACLEKDELYEFAKPWLGEGLVTGKAEIWKNHRKLINCAFNQSVLDGFVAAFNKQARRFVKALDKEVGHGPFDHWIYTRHNALETICLTALGVDFTDHTLLNGKYVAATEEMFGLLAERFQNIFMHSQWIFNWTGLKKKQDRLVEILHNMAYTVLQRRKSEINGNEVSLKLTEKKLGSKFKPFLDLLLELTMEKNAFTDQEIRENLDSMIVGGHDTTASALMFTMVMLGSFPEVQDKVVKELQEVFGDSDRDAEKHDLSRLVYLEAVIKECIRLVPIVPVVARKVDRDVELKKYKLRAGRTCFILLYGVNRHPIWGADAREFKPSRWLDPATMPDHPNAFAGFSLGKRYCIGKGYALMSMKTTLAHVLRHYKIDADWSKLRVKLDVMLKPLSGHHISIERR